MRVRDQPPGEPSGGRPPRDPSGEQQPLARVRRRRPRRALRRLRQFVKHRVRETLHARESTDTLSLVGTAVLVGVAVGFAAVGFDAMVETFSEWIERARLRPGDAQAGRAPLLDTAMFGTLAGDLRRAAITLLAPALGGLAITPIVLVWAQDARGPGVSGVMLAVSNLGGRVPKRLLFWRPVATTISIGSGASLGTEGPVVQLGAAVASTLAGWLRLNDERRRNLVAVAAAGGIAATFNAPIAGVLFSLEVVLGRFQARNFSTVVIGAVAATAVSRTILGESPAFPVSASFDLLTPLELPLYLLLGALCAFVGIGFIRTAVAAEDLFNRLPVPWLRPALGGLAVGVIALAVPAVLGRGYATIGNILQGEVPALGALAVLVVAKTLATSLSLGSWGSGGIFAPALFLGATFGALFGQVALPLAGIEGQPGAYALVAMAAVFSGVTRAPMSSIVMVFELSGSYSLILPLLLSAVIATLIADIFHPESFYQMNLSRRGLALFRSRETDLLQTVTVREVMDKDVPTVYADDTLVDLASAMQGSHHHGFVVARREDPAPMVGIVTLTDLERARHEGRDVTTPVGHVCQTEVHTAHPDDAAADVLERMVRLGVGRMPVVDPQQPTYPVGYVRQADLAKAYYLALQRERQEESELETLRLRDLTGQEIVEVRVPVHSRLAGSSLREAGLPEESIVVAVRRRGKTIFPHGETTIEPGDTVVANVSPGFGPTFRERFAAVAEGSPQARG